MPAISLCPVPLYQPTDAYTHAFDNVPILGLIARIDLVNAQVDNNTTDLNAAVGSQGSLANRLDQSLNEDGSLKTTAINNALHSIADHLDTATYVRMTLNERAKLSFIATNATNLTLNVQTISGIRIFNNDVVTIQPSDSITWRSSGDNVYADTTFPQAAKHQHYYSLIPVPQNLIIPDYKNYYTTSVATAYKEGSLRVFVNGVRLNQVSSVYAPTNLPSTLIWQPLYFTEATATGGIVTTGKFALSAAIPAAAVITVDFDIQLT